MTKPQSATADLGDVTLRYTVTGTEGPWVTLIHGGTMSSEGWETHPSTLAGGARVLTFDLRGYGGSSRPAGGYTVAQFAADLLGLWDAIGVDRSIVVGFSMGGFIALEVALTAPERVSSMMLVGTAGGLPEATTRDFLQRAEDLERSGTEASVVAALRGIATFDRRADLDRLDCPVLVVCGEADTAIPVAHSRALHEAIAGSRLVTIPGVGHRVHAEAPDRFAALVRDAVAAADPLPPNGSRAR